MKHIEHRTYGKNGLLTVTLGSIAMMLALLVMTPQNAHAATPDFTLLLAIPALMDQALFLISLVAIAISFKVYSLVKGGLLAKSWQMFVVGLLCLAIAQLFELAHLVGLFVPPDALRPGILICMVGLWLYGAYAARNALG